MKIKLTKTDLVKLIVARAEELRSAREKELRELIENEAKMTEEELALLKVKGRLWVCSHSG